MKKLLTLFLALAFGMSLKAQCHISEAVDFTVTDIYGREIHLFDILDGGQHVLIDFFYTDCSGCIQTIPYVKQAYQELGCNMHDVFFMEVDFLDSEADCINWATNYAVDYPTISGDAGGTNICIDYGVSIYPTVILIAPDRQIVIQELWPIGSPNAIINALQPYGIEQHDCSAPAPVSNPEVSIYIDQILETEVTVTFTPNADCASYNYMMATESEIQQWMGLAGLELPQYLANYGFPAEGVFSHTFTELETNTEYVIYAVPADFDGNLGEVVQETVVTGTGGTAEIIIDFTGTDLDGKEIHLYDILDTGKFVFINFFLTGDPLSEQPMPDIIEAYRMYGCNQHDVIFMGISPNGGDAACQNWIEQFGVEYPVISRAGGGNNIVQAIPVALYPGLMLIRPDHTIAQREIYPPTIDYIIRYFEAAGIEEHACETGVDEAEQQALTLFPNPAHDFVTVKGENLGTVSIYNTLGQKLDEFEATGNELRINTANYDNGVYVVRNSEKMIKFVVKH